MSDVNKNEIDELKLLLLMIRDFNVKNGIAMAFDSDKRELWFFKKNRYLECGKCEGIAVSLEDLVR